jgi:hypothetical protein
MSTSIAKQFGKTMEAPNKFLDSALFIY